ncbi:WGR domain-containing protein [Pseudoscourfieldia marina]
MAPSCIRHHLSRELTEDIRSAHDGPALLLRVQPPGPGKSLASSFGFAAGTAKALSYLLAEGGTVPQTDGQQQFSPITLAPNATLVSEPHDASTRRLFYVLYLPASDDDSLLTTQMLHEAAEELGLLDATSDQVYARMTKSKDAQEAAIDIEHSSSLEDILEGLLLVSEFYTVAEKKSAQTQKSMYEAAVEALRAFVDDDDNPDASAGGKSVWEQISEAMEARVEELVGPVANSLQVQAAEKEKEKRRHEHELALARLQTGVQVPAPAFAPAPAVPFYHKTWRVLKRGGEIGVEGTESAKKKLKQHASDLEKAVCMPDISSATEGEVREACEVVVDWLEDA